MRKSLLALGAISALAAPANAADMAARPYTKAPAQAMATNWTGFYVFGGAGGGLWAADTSVLNNTSLVQMTRNQRMGGSGWFGTVGAGYDWQFNGGWVAGVLADGQFGSIEGTLADPAGRAPVTSGSETLRNSYAAGVRLGYLVAPNVLSYVNGGYSGSQWSGSTHYTVTTAAVLPIFTTPSFTRNGVFIGGGVENSLNIFGITAPGWFMKTEYRGAYYGRVTLPETVIATGLPFLSDTFKPWVQTISTSLVYRFNSTGTVVAKY
jgi:outer membrane immunogenic protein